jgi:hypothetical protein
MQRGRISKRPPRRLSRQAGAITAVNAAAKI